ncbi:poly(ADP-ribose) polymerase family member 14-related sequence 1 [Neosynchiropus ocellatus]
MAAGAYSLRLLVELEENDTPKLKTKLVKYFQSKKSHGGDCEVDYENGSRTAVLRFRAERDRQNVLAKEAHQIDLPRGVLKMKVSLLTDDVTGHLGGSADDTGQTEAAFGDDQDKSLAAKNDGTPEDELRSVAAVLENVPESLTRGLLEMLVENILKAPNPSSPAKSYRSLEIIPEMSSAVVTLQNAEETSAFIQRCPENKVFKRNGLSVRPLEVTKQVLVEGVQVLSEDGLHLYFGKEGDVETVAVNEDEDTALITFVEPQAAQKTLTKKHSIQGNEVKVYPFYESLGTALYGPNRPVMKLPASILEPIDNTVRKYLEVEKAEAETIDQDLAEAFCRVELRESTVCLSPLPSLIKQRDAKKLTQRWNATAKSAFEQSMSRFKRVTFQPGSDSMEETEEAFQEMLPKNMLLIPEKNNGEITVVGRKDDVDKYKDVLSDKVRDTVKTVQRRKLTVTQHIEVSPSVLHILNQHGLQTKLLGNHPELQMSFEPEKKRLSLTGLNEEICHARDTFFGEVFCLKINKLEVDGMFLDFLRSEDQEELTEVFFKPKEINAAFKMNAGVIQLTAMSDFALTRAEEHLKNVLKPMSIHLHDRNVVKMPAWGQLVRELEDDHKELSRKILIKTEENEVVVFGHEGEVTSVCGELEEFIEQNSFLEEVIPVQPSIRVKFILECENSWLRNMPDGVKVSPVSGGVRLSGRRADVEHCSTTLDNMLCRVCEEEFKIDKAGMKKFMKEEEAVYAQVIRRDTGCLVQLIDEPPAGGAKKDIIKKAVSANTAAPPLPPKTHQLKTLSNDPNFLGDTVTQEGVNITMMKGNIQEAETDAVVSSLSSDLNLSKGPISKAISDAAGPKLQDLVSAFNSAYVGDVFETEGCQLKSKKIIHAVCPHWHKGGGKEEQQLRGIIKKCLDVAANSGCTSISFPAVGSGNLGFPKALSASILFEEIVAFSTKQSSTNLKQVTLVLFPSDTQTIQDFGHEFQKRFPGATLGPSIIPKITGYLSKIVSAKGLHEAKYGAVTIQVVSGDITKETSDVIVNSSANNFTLKTGVSKAILEAAGQSVETECQTLAAQAHQGMIMTQPGNLKCKKILHLEGQTTPVKINAVVKDALEVCLKDAYKSVSFPAIGTGKGGVVARQVADAMLDAIVDKLSSQKSCSLERIRIVIFQTTMLKDFYESMHLREAPQAKREEGFFSRLRSFFTSALSPGREDEEMTAEGLNCEPVCFHVCGNTVAELASAKKWMEEYMIKEYTTISFTDDIITLFSGKDYKRINDMQKKMGLSIRTRHIQGKTSLTVEGYYKDVLKAGQEINEMMTSVRNMEEQRKNVELACRVADWRYQAQGNNFNSFDPETNFSLEQGLDNKAASVKVTIEGQDYTVTMPNGPATGGQGQTLQIKRIAKLKVEGVPDHWDLMPTNSTCHRVPLQVGTPEHTEVLKLFQATCRLSVLKIERIQNPALWKSLEIKKKVMEQKNGHQNNEKRLFHGTTAESVANINEEGFNRSFAGKNAANFGNGVYMAVSASYSAHDTYSKPDVNGERCMYLCRVLTGDYTLGQQHMKVPPAKTNSSQKYDSVVNDMQNPAMFVIFHDSQAYPEYLISFK